LVDGRAHKCADGHATLRDSLIVDGLWCAFEDWSMGHAAEFIADEFAVTREAMDRYALCSHHKAVAAQDAGRFDREIVPIDVPARKGGTVRVSEDEPPRRDTSLDALARLPPAFRSGGRVTAGNAPGLNDAAAAVVVASRQRAEAIGTPPLARIAGYAQVAMSPKHIFATPAAAIRKLLVRIGWPLSSVDAIELNEAFAAQALAVLRELPMDPERVNVNGGAIALGHPLGCTGAKLTTSLLYEMRRRKSKYGLVSMCVGGGMGAAGIFERL
jgi:acetyl-CoA C-acetyltransferase